MASTWAPPSTRARRQEASRSASTSPGHLLSCAATVELPPPTPACSGSLSKRFTHLESRMVTLAEVAQHAGVSASTVSYVLSGKRSISVNTRQRVERSIHELGYHPNAGARALASSRSNIIALMIPLRTD